MQPMISKDLPARYNRYMSRRGEVRSKVQTPDSTKVSESTSEHQRAGRSTFDALLCKGRGGNICMGEQKAHGSKMCGSLDIWSLVLCMLVFINSERGGISLAHIFLQIFKRFSEVDF